MLKIRHKKESSKLIMQNGKVHVMDRLLLMLHRFMYRHVQTKSVIIVKLSFVVFLLVACLFA